MALSVGTQLGAFEITGSLGAGGMGEVYRARDTKLGRDVAIKTLPSALASDKERLARFEREAKLLAALNHPYIATVHALDERDGTLYVAMELVEGETLEQKLKGGALPVDDALRLGLQIAEALEAAHGKGVIHRDLKPANVMVTRDGQAKVLDFGLAKAFSSAAEEASPLHSPALSVAMTQRGLVLGTAGYMSPEQASGQATDQRSDIWAFGVVLYEMLTGLPLFTGESVPHILAEVLKTEPEWRRLPKNLHPRIRQLLERCLTKKPRNRLHSIADARVEIEAVLGDPRGVTPEIPVGTAAGRSSSTLRLAGAVVAIAVVAAAAGWWLRPSEPKSVVRFSVQLPADQSISESPVSMIAVSPDGARVAYIANGQIFLRDLDESEARPVSGTAEAGPGAVQPVFSPDGQWLAYVHARGEQGPFSLKRVPISGGAPVSIYEAATTPSFPYEMTWPTMDAIVFSSSAGIVRISANGGAPEVLVPKAEDEVIYRSQLLPGGEAVLFTRLGGTPEPAPGTNFDAAQIVVQSIGGNDRTVVWPGGSAARYLPTGHIVYAQGTTLFALGFDPARRAVRGGPVPLLAGLRRSANAVADAANFAVSDNGTLVMIPGDPNAAVQTRITTTLAWVDREGREEPVPVRPDDYTMARISPDGRKVALVVGASLNRPTTPAIWIFDLQTENLRLLTADPEGDDGPVWSSDSRRIYFRSFRGDSPTGVYAIDLDTGETTLVATSPDHPFPYPWTISPDDRTLGIVSALTLDDINIATLSVADGEFTTLLAETTSESEPAISPNGAWVAYSEGATPGDPNAEINIRPFPGVSRTRIPVARGQAPVFARDGSELFFVDGDGLMSAPISYEPTLRVGAPRRLFGSPAYMWNVVGRTWDADPSGERFLIIRVPGTAEVDEEPSQQRIDVVINWVEELKSRVPVD